MKHLGDITKLNGHEVPVVDIVCGGSPCQDLSVAGKRAGLSGERSGLFMDQIRIIKEMRDESVRQLQLRGSNVDFRLLKPRYMVWENVPGAFSSNGGEDFRAVLEETARVADKDAIIPRPSNGKWPQAGCIVGDGWSIAWRIHDAQYWGVPQRRKRICLLADFNGESAGYVLFELWRKTDGGNKEQTVMDIGEESRSEVSSVTEGMSGNLAKGGKEREGAAADVGSCIEETGKCLNGWDIQSKHIQPENGIAESLYAGECRGGGGESYVLQGDGAISFQERAGKPGGGGKGILIQNERTGALSTLNNQSVCIGVDVYNHTVSGDIAVTLNASSGACGSRSGPSVMVPSDQQIVLTNVDDTVRADAEDNHQAVVYGISAYDSNAMKSANPNSGIYEAETSRTLDLNGGSPACNQGGMAVVCLEGNGSRPSHRGDGYSESETMYTLNGTEHHAVVVESHAQDARYNVGEVNQPLSANMEHDPANGGLVMVVENHPNDSRVKVSEDGVVQTLSGRMGTGGGNVPMVMDMLNLNPKTDDICQTLNAYNGTGGNNMPLVMEPTAFSETAAARCAQDGRGRVHSQMLADPESNFILEPYTSSKASYHQHFTNDGKAETLVASDYKDPPTVTYGLDRSSYNQGKNAKYDFSVEEEKIATCVAQGPGAVCKAVDCINGAKKSVNGTLATNACKSLNSGNVERCESIVRRLTPLECTRLQGFPDGWVDIGEWVDSQGKVHKESDAPKYKALGNSIALPFWKWLAKRIRMQYPNNCKITMASLFDGIGGFPLSFIEAGIDPIWASEIEEFPIAVTKKHFPNME